MIAALRLRKLAQEAYIVLEKDLDVIDAVLEHGQAIHAHAEGEAADLFCIVIHEAVNGGVDHARAEEFDPAGALALAAGCAGGSRAAASAKNTGHVEFHRRFRERKIAGAETRFHALAEELLHEIFDGAGEIAEGDVRVDSQSFDLVEYEGVGSVGIVATVDLAGHDDANGRLALLHGANLHG